MTEHYRFFNSDEEDQRVYDAGDFAEYFETLINSGVWAEELNALQVSGHGGEMKSIVHTGKAFIDGHFYYNDADLEVEHATADVTHDRLDRVVLRLDLNANERSLKVAVKTGTPSATPSPPSVTRTQLVREYSLAQVLVRAGQSYIEVEDVTDDRGDESVCGYARYRAKPAWYPGGDIPMDVWKYRFFRNEMTTQEIEDVQENPGLMDIFYNSTRERFIGDNIFWYYGQPADIDYDCDICPDTDQSACGISGSTQLRLQSWRLDTNGGFQSYMTFDRIIDLAKYRFVYVDMWAEIEVGSGDTHGAIHYRDMTDPGNPGSWSEMFRFSTTRRTFDISHIDYPVQLRIAVLAYSHSGGSRDKKVDARINAMEFMY